MSLIDLFTFLPYIFYSFQEKRMFGAQYLKPYFLIFGAPLSVLIIFTLERGYLIYFHYISFLLWTCLCVIWSVKHENSVAEWKGRIKQTYLHNNYISVLKKILT